MSEAVPPGILRRGGVAAAAAWGTPAGRQGSDPTSVRCGRRDGERETTR